MRRVHVLERSQLIGRPRGSRVRLLRRRAEPGGDHAAVAALPGHDPPPDRDARGCADRVPAAPSRAADPLADADRGLGSAAALRRRPAARAIPAVGAHAHVRAGRGRRGDPRPGPLRAAVRPARGARARAVRAARPAADLRPPRGSSSDDRAALAHARPARARPSGAARRAGSLRAHRSGVLLRRPAPARPPRVGPAHAVPARVPRGPRPAARRDPRAAPRRAGARAAPPGRRGRRGRAALQRGHGARSRGGASSACGARWRSRRSAIRGSSRSTTSTRCAPRPASPTRCSRRFTGRGSRSRAARCSGARAHSAPSPPAWPAGASRPPPPRPSPMRSRAARPPGASGSPRSCATA